MKKAKVSFIVPVYNVEKYLGKCIDSIIEQSVDGKEIILVNDGSTDKSLDICNEYAGKYHYIKVINKCNGGLSSSRNVGIANAEGEYLFFIDSDDFLLGDYVANIYNICIDNNLDIIRCVYCRYSDTENKLYMKEKKEKPYYNQVLNGLEFLENEIKYNSYEVVACLGLFKKEYLIRNNINFVENVTHEDHEFFLKCLLAEKNNRIMRRDIQIYAYREREGSITKTPNVSKAVDILKNVESMITYVNKFNFSKSKLRIVKKPISALFYQLTSIYGRVETKDKKIIFKLVPKKLKRDLIKYAFNPHQRFKLILFFYFRYLVDFIYKIKKT